MTDIWDVLGVEVVDGEFRLKLGDAARGIGFDQDVPLMGTGRVFDVPDDPDEDGSACQAFVWFDGDNPRAIAARDNRYSSKAGAIKAGDLLIASPGEARIVMKKAADSVTLYTLNEPEGQSMMVHLDGGAGVLQLFNGDARVQLKHDSIVLKINGSTSLEINAQGVFITGSNFQANCPQGHLGQMGPGVPPVAPARSILAGPTGLAAAPSALWTVGL